MKRGRLFLLCVSLFLVFSVSFAYGQAKTYSLSTFFPAPHKNTVVLTDWAKEVEKATKGEVKITIFPGGTLTPPDKCYDGVVNGISDFGNSDPSYTRGRFPLQEVFYLPLGYKSASVATKMVNDYIAKFNPKEFEAVKIMFFIAHGPGFIHTKKPVKSLEELKGLKIRCSGNPTKIVKALGATPVAMPMSESYDALSRGITEGIVAPFEALKGWKLGEVIKSTTMTYAAAYTSTFFVIMNKDKWNALSPANKKAIEAVNKKYVAVAGAAWDAIDKEGIEFTKKQGNQIVTLSKAEEAKWAAAVKPLFDAYVKESGEKGVDGKAALKFCQDYLAKFNK